MGKYICAIDSSWDLTLFLDRYVNFWWYVKVNSVQDMVNKVLQKAGGNQISTLVIVGHGKPGVQKVGCGHDLDPTLEKSLVVESTTGQLVGNAEHHLGLLKPKFEKNAIVSLTGCRTGQGKRGEELLKRLAYVLGVRVEAGVENQRVMPGFEGPVRRCDDKSCILLPANTFY